MFWTPILVSKRKKKIIFSVKILFFHYCHWHLQSRKLRSKSTALEPSSFTRHLCLGSSFFYHPPSIHLFPFPCPQAYLQIHVVWICFVCKTSLTIETFLSSPVLPSTWCHLYTHTPHSSPVLKEALCLVWLNSLSANLTWLSYKHIASALLQSKAIDFHSDIQPKKDDHMPRSNHKKKNLIHSTNPIDP